MSWAWSKKGKNNTSSTTTYILLLKSVSSKVYKYDMAIEKNLWITNYPKLTFWALALSLSIHADKGLMPETSALKLLTVANLHFNSVDKTKLLRH